MTSKIQKQSAITNADPLAMALAIDRIEVCEPRLALSASVAADVLLEAFSVIDPSSQPAHDTFVDASTVRQQHGFNGAGQTVAVIDTGIAWNHWVFSNEKSGSVASGRAGGFGEGFRVVGGWDFAENDADPYDDAPAGFHGTHVASILAGFAPGFSGVATAADIVSLRVFDDFGRSSLDWVESALQWVIKNRETFEHPITTVNLSLGATIIDTNQPLTQLDDELRTLRDGGVIIVAATGNSFDASKPDAVTYPASNPLVAAVTSVDVNGNIDSFAQRTSGVFATMGSNIRGAVPDFVQGIDGDINDFASSSGTSMATPQFAGATMLVREAMQSLGMTPTVDGILAQLRDTSVQHTDAISGAQYRVIDLDGAINNLFATRGSSGEDIAATSPLHWTGPTSLQVIGTDANDRITLDLSGVKPSLTINDVRYPIDRTLLNITIEGQSGMDSLQIFGGNGDERVVARSALSSFDEATASLQTPGLTGDFRSFESVVFRGGGGNDRATFYDSPGDDTLEATPSEATLRGTGYTFVAQDVKNLYAHATGGGSDTAFLYDSSGDDRLAIRHQFTSMRSDSLFRLAYGFEKVHAFAGAGGSDHADLYDSPGDDRMSASANSAWISGRDYYAGARGFASVSAVSSAGGHDYATLYATDTTALWTRSATLLQMNAPEGVTRSAQGFETAEAFVAGAKTSVLPMSIREAFYEDEHDALRSLFAEE